MKFLPLRDKRTIERFLRRDEYLHIYELGDLDDFFWPHTKWFGCESGGRIQAVILVYDSPSMPTVLALARETEAISWLLASAVELLPQRFYAHLSPGLSAQLRPSYRLGHGVLHCKMALRKPELLPREDDSAVVPLGTKDRQAVEAFYTESYPANWFDPRMLETKQYGGIFEAGRLVSVAGVHVYSEPYGVAALGNIATLPSHRRRGLASRSTAALCRSLSRRGIRVGLNVAARNEPAVSCYEKLGFETIAWYEEFVIEKDR